MDRRASAGLARNVATLDAFQDRICRILPCAGDRGAMVSRVDTPGRLLYPLFPGGILCDGFRRPACRHRHRARRRGAGRRRQFRGRRGGLCKAGACSDLSGRVRPHDMGDRALSLHRLAATGDRQPPDPGRGVSQAHSRRASAPPEKQAVDYSCGSSSGAA